VKVRLVAVAYALVATLAAGLAVALRDGRIFSHPAPWLVLDETTAVAASVVLGVAFTAVVVATTRVFVSRFAWAHRLAGELRPFARGLGPTDVLVLAALSSLGEELLFRSLLLPFVGLALSSVLFGVVHQVRGPARWAWATWAGLVAHAAINGLNLAWLQKNEPARRRRALGGLFHTARR
jgi:membrane protease YdiL (CAAX protease family)